MVSVLYSLALTPLRPLLIGRNPVLLELMGGSMTAMVASGAFARVGQAPLALAVLAALPGAMMFDPFYWWAGRRWGRTMIDMFAGPRAIARGERVFHRYGPVVIVAAYFLPIPVTIIYAFAGWSGMRLRTFILLDLMGTLLWVATLVGLGYGLGGGAVAIAKEVSHYGLVISLALTAVVVVPVLWRLRGIRAASASVSPRE
jgi:membrane protein DedA with SNARE-associated domain